jgi:hypothetical protein
MLWIIRSHHLERSAESTKAEYDRKSRAARYAKAAVASSFGDLRAPVRLGAARVETG